MECNCEMCLEKCIVGNIAAFVCWRNILRTEANPDTSRALERINPCLSRTLIIARNYCPELLIALELQSAQERDQVFLLCAVQINAQHQIEKLYRIFQRQQTIIMQIGWRIFNTTQGEGLDRAIS